MSVRRIAHGSAEDVDEFIYHCPMCDIETKQQVLHLFKLTAKRAPSN
jgi:hypothetical protein